jgi:hypothetical protein
MGSLNDVMEFDHTVRVHADGTVTDAEPGAPWAPEVYDAELPAGSPWRLMTGYTGQHGYNGPSMHASEFIGGRMADDILANPGLYVALVDNPLNPDNDDDVNGWCVAYIHDES